MATQLPVVRQPFGELASSRLQQLASVKNSQNGLVAKISPSHSKSILSTGNGKRSFASTSLDDNAENMDPALFNSPSKKNKSDLFQTPVKSSFFSLAPPTSMPPPSSRPARLTTPVRTNMQSPRQPLTAPAGRSPKRKVSAISKSRHTSAPFTRIDPPFASRSSSSALPFSLDAALNSTLNPSSFKAPVDALPQAMPSKWRFDIYEDTPEEEAANLMEHSTLTLDLSSDEEDNSKAREDRGKENVAPDGYDAPSAPASATASVAPSDALPASVDSELASPMSSQIKNTNVIRRKLNVDEMDDGERSPLSDLDTDPFIPDGLDKASHVIVDGEVHSCAGLDSKKVFATSTRLPSAPTSASAQSANSKSEARDSTVKSNGGVQCDIVIFEDTATADGLKLAEVSRHVDAKMAKAAKAATNENAAPLESTLQ